MNPIIIIGGIALLALLANMAGGPAEEPDPDPDPALSATEHISISVQ